MARAMTPLEKHRFKAVFPNLDVDQTVVTGEISIVYNCIAWTVGFSDRWIWPGDALADFDAFYHRFGFDPIIVNAGADAMAKAKKSYLTAAQKKILRDLRKRIPPEVQSNYEAAFGAWKDSWFSGGLAFNSNPHFRAVGKEYDSLIALGPSIIPLLVESLAEPDNFLALQLYDAIQSNDHLVVNIGPNDERIVEGEQGRARRVVQTWFANR